MFKFMKITQISLLDSPFWKMNVVWLINKVVLLLRFSVFRKKIVMFVNVWILILLMLSLVRAASKTMLKVSESELEKLSMVCGLVKKTFELLLN